MSQNTFYGVRFDTDKRNMRIPYFKFCNLHAEALVRKKGLTALLLCKLNALLKQSVTHQTRSLVTEDASSGMCRRVVR